MLPSVGSRRRWAPAAAQTDRVSSGLAPGPGTGPPPPPPPRAQAASSRGHGVALGPPLRVSASAALVPGSRCPRSSSSAQAAAALRTPSPASGGRRAQRAAEAPEALGRRRGGRRSSRRVGGWASAGRPRRRRVPGAGTARGALRIASPRELGPGSGGGQSRRAPTSGRQEAACPGAGASRGRRAQQPAPPPRSRRGHGRAWVRAGPPDPQSLLARWTRSRGRAGARRPWEGARVPGLGASAVQPGGVAGPRQMPPAKLDRRKLQLQGDSGRYANCAPRNRRP